MSTYYNIRTEVKVNGAWHCVDPLILQVKDDGSVGEYKLASTYWNGSQSYFGAAADKLIEISMPCKYDEYSPEIKALFDTWKFDYEDKESYLARNTYAIPLARVKAAVDSLGGKTNHAIVHKDSIVAFETGDIEDIYNTIDPQDYSVLDPEAKKLYQYYEWDEAMHWGPYLRKVLEKAYWRVSDFTNANWIEQEVEARLIMYIS